MRTIKIFKKMIKVHKIKKKKFFLHVIKCLELVLKHRKNAMEVIVDDKWYIMVE